MSKLRHIALGILKEDLEEFYLKILGGEEKGSFLLTKEDSMNIFNIENSSEVYWVECMGVDLELFLHEQKEVFQMYQHLCFESTVAEEIFLKAQEKGYFTYIRKRQEKITYFIKDKVGNLFEIKYKNKKI